MVNRERLSGHRMPGAPRLRSDPAPTRRGGTELPLLAGHRVLRPLERPLLLLRLEFSSSSSRTGLTECHLRLSCFRNSAALSHGTGHPGPR